MGRFYPTRSFLNTDLKRLWRTSLAGLKTNLLPGLVLWSVSLVVVVAYYFWAPAAAWLGVVAEMKVRYGYWYSAVATAVAGGVVPVLVLILMGKIREGAVVGQVVFYVVFWAWRGVEVDAIYRLQSWVFGDSAEVGTIVSKVLVDQFVYCPLWAAPVTAVFYLWKDNGFVWRGLGKRFYVERVAPVLLSTWLVWIPAVSLIYALPLALQVPLFNLVLCFFVLLVAALGDGD